MEPNPYGKPTVTDRVALLQESSNLRRKGLVSVGKLARNLSMGVRLPNDVLHRVSYPTTYLLLINEGWLHPDVTYDQFAERNGLT